MNHKISLQQASFFSTLNSSSDDESNDASTAVFACCHHRRSNSLLRKNSSSFCVYSSELDGTWTLKGEWKIPEKGEIFRHFIVALSLESLDAFLVIFSGTNGTRLTFLDLKGTVTNELLLAQITNAKCADFDQQRKELIMGVPSGRIVSFSIRFSSKKDLLKTEVKVREFHAIARRHVRLPKDVGRTPIQIITQDVVGTSLVLFESGGIVSLESSTLDLIWAIDKMRFSLTPSRLWADKFGIDFIVFCKGSSKDCTIRENVEYWTPPISHSDCESNQFGRSVIPVVGPVLSLCIESVGRDGQSVMVAIMTKNDHVHLFKVVGHANIFLESDMHLTGEIGAFASSARGQLVGQPDEDLNASDSVFAIASFLQTPSFVRNDSLQALQFLYGGAVLLVAMHLPQTEDYCCQDSLINLLFEERYRQQELARLRRRQEDNQIYNAKRPGPLAYEDFGVEVKSTNFDRRYEGGDLEEASVGTISTETTSLESPMPHARTPKRSTPNLGPLDCITVLEDTTQPILTEGENAGIVHAQRAADGENGNVEGDFDDNVSEEESVVAPRVYSFSRGRSSPIPSRPLSPKTSLSPPVLASPPSPLKSSVRPLLSPKDRVSMGSRGKVSARFSDCLVDPEGDGAGAGQAVYAGLDHMQEIRGILVSREIALSGPAAAMTRTSGTAVSMSSLPPNTPMTPMNELVLDYQNKIQQGLFSKTPAILQNGGGVEGGQTGGEGAAAESSDVKRPAVFCFQPVLLASSTNGSDLSLSCKQCLLKLVSPPSCMMLTVAPAAASEAAVAATAAKRSTGDTELGQQGLAGGSMRGMKKSSPATSAHLLTRRGYADLQRPPEELFSLSLELQLTCFAERTGCLGVVTPMRECFIIEVGSVHGSLGDDKVAHSGPSGPNGLWAPLPPMRVDLNVSQQATASAILLADVCLLLPAERRGPMARVTGAPSAVVGAHLLFLLGDSEGMLHFALSTRSAVISTGQLSAHSSPVVAILTSGDPFRPLWKVGLDKPVKDASTKGATAAGAAGASSKFAQPIPVAVAGSGIVTVAKDGEVKVWQPVFSPLKNARSKDANVLSVFTIHWKLVGMFSSRQVGPGKGSSSRQQYRSITCALLDPVSMTILVAFGDGKTDQWPLPGLVSSGSEGQGLLTCRESLWSRHMHAGAVLDMRLWVHTTDSSVREVSVEDTAASSKGSVEVGRARAKLLAAFVKGKSALNTTIGYTFVELSNIVKVSSMVTTSSDLSLVLWKFQLTEAPIETASGKDMNVYMYPLPCRRFVFSTQPRAGLCFGTSKMSAIPAPPAVLAAKLNWTFSAIVAGVVVTVIRGETGEVFAEDGTLGLDAAQRYQPENKSLSQVAHAIPVQAKVDLQASSVASKRGALVMPVVCNVVKPLRVIALTSKSAEAMIAVNSWNLLNEWTLQQQTQQAQQQQQQTAAPDAPTQPSSFSWMAFAADADSPSRPCSPEKRIDVFADQPQGSMILLAAPDLQGPAPPPSRGLYPLRDTVIAMAQVETKAIVETSALPAKTNDGRKKVYFNGLHLSVPGINTEAALKKLQQDGSKRFVVAKGDPISDDLEEGELSPRGEGMESARSPEPGTVISLPAAQSSDNQGADDNSVDIGLGSMPVTPLGSKLDMTDTFIEVGPKKDEDLAAVKQTRSAMLRQAQQLKKKDRLQDAARKSNKKSVYTSKSSLDKRLSSLQDGVRQTSGHAVLVTPAVGASDKNLIAAFNKVVPEKEGTTVASTLSPIDDSYLLEDDDQHQSLPPPEFIDDNTSTDPSLKLAVTDKGRRIPALIPKLGVVLADTAVTSAALHTKEGRMKDANTVAASVAGFAETTEFADNPTYFSFAAKPIVLRKPPPFVKRLVSKRFDVTEDDDDSTLASLIPTATLKQFKAVFSSEDVDRIKMAFDNLTDDWLDFFQALEEKDQTEFLKDFVTTSAGVSPEKMTVHLISALKSFKNVLKARVAARRAAAAESGDEQPVVEVVEEVIELEEPFLSFEQKKVTSTTVTVEASSPDPARITVLIYEDGKPRPNVSLVEAAKGDLKALHAAMPDIVQAKVSKIGPDEKEVRFTFEDLLQEKAYKIFAHIDCNLEKVPRFHQMTDDAFKATFIRIKTPPEPLFIEWSRLSPEGQRAEVSCATRCCMVQAIAASQKIVLPSDEEIAEASGQVWMAFVNWWTEGDLVENGFGEHRRRFLVRECAWAAQDSRILAEYEQLGFVNISTAHDLKKGAMLITEMDMDALSKVLLLGSQASVTSVASTVKSANSKSLLKNKVSRVMASQKSKDAFPQISTRFDMLFREFRSWYKGGLALLYHMRKRDAMGKNLSTSTTSGGAAPGVPNDSSTTADKAVEPMQDSLTSGPTPPPTAAAIASGAPIVAEGSEEVSAGGAAVAEAFAGDLIEKRRQDRCLFLQERRDLVDNCTEIVADVIGLYKKAKAKKIGLKDLLFRRAKLSEEDAVTIMGLTKLVELCTAQKLVGHHAEPDPSLLGEPPFTLQAIAGADVFYPCDPESLKPLDPPVVERTCMPGTKRRPTKPWQFCSEAEKLMELCLACSCDSVVIAAIEDGVCAPDPEDVLLDPTFFAARAERWKEFTDWYAGNEALVSVPGRGIPTLARVLVAEEWENPTVIYDPFVYESMLALDFPFPDDYVHPGDTSAIAEAAAAEREAKGGDGDGDGDDVSELGDGPGDGSKAAAAVAAESMDSSGKAQGAHGGRKPNLALLELYEGGIATSQGQELRLKLLLRSLDAITTSRRLDMTRLLFPPGPVRLGYQFMFPRVGLITPKLELPQKRYRLFLSRSTAGYTVKEILGWYSAEQMDEDDALMAKAELDGQKRRLYLEWLLKEDDRRIESREMMLEEDRTALLGRSYWQLIAVKLQSLENNDPCATATTFGVLSNMPGDYEFLKTDATIFKNGSGLHNDDELEDVKEAQRRAAEKAKEDAKSLQQKVMEDRVKKERDEAMRQKREEQDRRLKERMEYRRHLREHFEDVKEKRKQHAQQLELDKLVASRKAAFAREEEANHKRIEAAKKKEEDRRLFECAMMEQEELTLREVINVRYEMMQMAHEDIFSTLREKQDALEDQYRRERRVMLEEIYEPFLPFDFTNRRVRLPVLHSILSTTKGDDDNEDGDLDRVDGEDSYFGRYGHYSRSKCGLDDGEDEEDDWGDSNKGGRRAPKGGALRNGGASESFELERTDDAGDASVYGDDERLALKPQSSKVLRFEASLHTEVDSGIGLQEARKTAGSGSAAKAAAYDEDYSSALDYFGRISSPKPYPDPKMASLRKDTAVPSSAKGRKSSSGSGGRRNSPLAGGAGASANAYLCTATGGLELADMSLETRILERTFAAQQERDKSANPFHDTNAYEMQLKAALDQRGYVPYLDTRGGGGLVEMEIAARGAIRSDVPAIPPPKSKLKPLDYGNSRKPLQSAHFQRYPDYVETLLNQTAVSGRAGDGRKLSSSRANSAPDLVQGQPSHSPKGSIEERRAFRIKKTMDAMAINGDRSHAPREKMSIGGGGRGLGGGLGGPGGLGGLVASESLPSLHPPQQKLNSKSKTLSPARKSELIASSRAVVGNVAQIDRLLTLKHNKTIALASFSSLGKQKKISALTLANTMDALEDASPLKQQLKEVPEPSEDENGIETKKGEMSLKPKPSIRMRKEPVVPVVNGVLRTDLIPIARAAGARATKISEERMAIKQYVASKAVLEDGYFLETVTGLEKEQSFIDSMQHVQKFREEIMAKFNIDGSGNQLPSPVNASALKAAAAPALAPTQAPTEGKADDEDVSTGASVSDIVSEGGNNSAKVVKADVKAGKLKQKGTKTTAASASRDMRQNPVDPPYSGRQKLGGLGGLLGKPMDIKKLNKEEILAARRFAASSLVNLKEVEDFNSKDSGGSSDASESLSTTKQGSKQGSKAATAATEATPDLALELSKELSRNLSREPDVEMRSFRSLGSNDTTSLLELAHSTQLIQSTADVVDEDEISVIDTDKAARQARPSPAVTVTGAGACDMEDDASVQSTEDRVFQVVNQPQVSIQRVASEQSVIRQPA